MQIASKAKTGVNKTLVPKVVAKLLPLRPPIVRNSDIPHRQLERVSPNQQGVATVNQVPIHANVERQIERTEDVLKTSRLGPRRTRSRARARILPVFVFLLLLWILPRK